MPQELYRLLAYSRHVEAYIGEGSSITNSIIYIDRILDRKTLRVMTFQEFYKGRADWARLYRLVPTESFKELIRELENDPNKFIDFPLGWKWDARQQIERMVGYAERRDVERSREAEVTADRGTDRSNAEAQAPYGGATEQPELFVIPRPNQVKEIKRRSRR